MARKQWYIVTDRFTMIEYRRWTTSPSNAKRAVLSSTRDCAWEDLEVRPMWSAANLKMLEEHNRRKEEEKRLDDANQAA